VRLGEGILDDLVNKLAAVLVLGVEDVGPEVAVATLDEVACLLLEHGVFVGHGNQLNVALATLVGNESEVRVALLAVLANGETVIVLEGGGERSVRFVHY